MSEEKNCLVDHQGGSCRCFQLSYRVEAERLRGDHAVKFLSEKLDEKDAALAEARAEIERLKEAHAGSIALYLKLESERDALEQQVRALREELEKRKGCDHLDAPYRRLLKENEALKARAAGLEEAARKARECFEFIEAETDDDLMDGCKDRINLKWVHNHMREEIEMLEKALAPVEGEGEGKI